MLSLVGKIKFLLDSAIKRIVQNQKVCPHCQSNQGVLVDKKYFFIDLIRCANCQILFRYPGSNERQTAEFYQSNYQSGTTTKLPSDVELDQLIEAKFSTISKNYQARINLLKNLGVKPGAKLFDYGCSWGYGVKQFEQAGYDASGFELSRPRADYAHEKLGVKVSLKEPECENSFDVIFCSHVLEHVACVPETLAQFKLWIKPGGILLAITPNGSDARKIKDPDSWHKSWGAVHPSLIDEKFYSHYFESKPYLITSKLTNTDEVQKWSQSRSEQMIGKLDGYELMIAVVMKE